MTPEPLQATHMRITAQHLDDAEKIPQGADLPLDHLPDSWAAICDQWFASIATDQWDDRLLAPAAAALYGLPMPEQMPRPGAVAAWTHREWIGWAVGHGFEEVPRSKHAYQYRHRLVPWLLLSMSSSPGDHRWSMATATDMRFAVDMAVKRLAANAYIACQVVGANVERHPSTAARERLRLLRHALITAGTDRESALRYIAVHGDLTWERFDLVEPDAEIVAEIRTAAAALQKEFDLSPRAALRRIGYDQDEAALLAKRLAANAGSDLLPGDLLDALEELIDRLREERAAYEHAKERLRDGRPADLPEAAPSIPQEDPAATERLELRRLLEVLRVTTGQAAAAIEQAAVAATVALERAALSPDTRVLQEENERLRGELAAVRAELAALQAKPRSRASAKRPH